jgi:hypothetical protein
MYVNSKMIPVETVPGIGGRWDKGENWRGCNLIHYKNLCKCYHVSPPRTTIKGK